MQIYFPGKSSKRELKTLCKTARLFFLEAWRTADRHTGDFSLIRGFRPEDLQELRVIQGKSNAHWGESDHNVMKGDNPWSMAGDICPYCHILKKCVWSDPELWKHLYEHFYKVAERMGVKIKCGVTLKDGTVDNPHIAFLMR